MGAFTTRSKLNVIPARGLFLCLIAGVLLIALSAPGATAGGSTGSHYLKEVTPFGWSFWGYGGKWTDNRYGDIVRGETELRSSYLWALGMSRDLVQVTRHFSLETELNLLVHSGLQDHREANAAISFRWWTFPWDRYLETTFAHGIGPSVASEEPPVEIDDDSADQFLLFMQTELTFAPPGDNGGWEVLFRIHHRSGVFGLISEDSGSNFLASGLRYRF